MVTYSSITKAADRASDRLHTSNTKMIDAILSPFVVRHRVHSTETYDMCEPNVLISVPYN